MKQNDGTMKEVQEVEIMFEETNEDLVTIAIGLVALAQATPHNVRMLNENS